MQKEFESHIDKAELFSKADKLLLALSGGIDSVVLAHLLKTAGFNFSIAHCNFKLRGKESDEDEKFCKALAKGMGVKIFTKQFDTKKYCQTHKVNIQLAARTLRYEWFRELMSQHHFDYLLTAHHANDVIETIFINLLRGTGINGIKGISEKKGQLIRPLIHFKKEEIIAYAKRYKLKFREDESNAEDKYQRNFIRLKIVPELKKINPTLEETFINNTKHFRQESEIVMDFLELKAAELILQTHDFTFINKKKLKKEKHLESILNFLIGGYGFNASQQKSILENLSNNALVGKVFNSSSHQLTIDRNDLVIKEGSKGLDLNVQFKSLSDLKKYAFLEVSKVKTFSIPKKNEVFLNPEQLIYPLTLRSKKTGDKFKPFGMKGFKLLSDFLKDEKLNLFQKENCKLLVNGNGDIMWVISRRSDERYKVDKTNASFLKLTFLDL